MRRLENMPLMVVAAICAALLPAQWANAHGILGNRFFPPTLATDDPFAVDELALPEITYIKNSGPASTEFDAGFEFDKEIFPRFAVGVSDFYTWQKPDRMPSIKGWDEMAITAKYEVWEDGPHEAIFSVGLEADIGGTGASSVGAESFSTFVPNFYFGKGFGDLPENLGGFQPFAVTGQIGQTFPTSAADPNVLQWGFAVEYSLPYLQQHVQDTGLPAPFKDFVPLVEFAMATGENRAQKGLTTGTINPGVLWITDYYELGVEANIPVNGASGAHVGVNLQLWIFIDDIFPKTFGHPLFGERS